MRSAKIALEDALNQKGKLIIYNNADSSKFSNISQDDSDLSAPHKNFKLFKQSFTKKLNNVVEELKAIQEVVECHYTTGKYSMFVKVYAKDNKHLLHLILDRLSSIDGVANTETFQLSLEEIFHRQLNIFGTEEDIILNE